MDAGGPQVRVVCVTTGADDGDDEVANHWNARGTQAAFRTAGTALAAAGARTARPLPAFGVLGVSAKTTRAELRALSKLVDGLPAACAEKAVAALLARCDCVRAVATTLDALAATPPSRLYRWSSALIGLVTPETVRRGVFRPSTSHRCRPVAVLLHLQSLSNGFRGPPPNRV